MQLQGQPRQEHRLDEERRRPRPQRPRPQDQLRQERGSRNVSMLCQERSGSLSFIV